MRARGLVRRRIIKAGNRGLYLVRRRTTIKTSGKALTGLAIGASAGAGATSFVLTATRLRGGISKDATVSIAGHTNPYVVAADADTDPGTNLLTITIPEPGLESAVTSEAVTVSTHAEFSYQRFRPQLDLDSTIAGVDGDSRRVFLAARDDGVRPRIGDLALETSGDTAARISTVKTLRPGGVDLHYEIVLGGGKAA